MLELEYHGKFVSVRVTVKLCPFHIRAPGLAYGDQFSLLEGLAAHFPDKCMEHRAVRRNLKIRFLCDLIDHVQTESAHTFVHPPEDHIIDLPANLLIFPVQIRLFYRKLMEIILSKLRHPLPGRTAKGGSHFIRRRVLCPVSPDIVIMIRIILALFRLQEPSVLIRGMVQHQIHDDADPVILCFPDQLLHIL